MAETDIFNNFEHTILNVALAQINYLSDVSFPDFPGCVTGGSTIDKAKDMAHDALSLHIKGMREDGENIPPPSKLEDIMDNPDYSNAIAILVVSVSEAKPRSVRVNRYASED